MGVGAKPSPDYDLASHVLGRFSKDDIAALDEVSPKVHMAVKTIISNGNCDDAMNKFNGK